MNMDALPLWASIPATILLVLAGFVTLIGSVGLLRLPDFFARVHAPSMGNTIGTGAVLIASMLITSAVAARPVVHELLITLFVVMSAPVSLMMLVRAALYRDKARNPPSH